MRGKSRTCLRREVTVSGWDVDAEKVDDEEGGSGDVEDDKEEVAAVACCGVAKFPRMHGIASQRHFLPPILVTANNPPRLLHARHSFST